MKWGLWSTTAASNSATPPDGWPEGQAPSTVNDCAREMMASIRTAITDLEFVDQGVTPTFVTATSFSFPNNQTGYFGQGQRVKCYDGSNILYGTVVSSTFTASTLVGLRMDNGAVLDTSLSAVASGIVSPVTPSLPETTYKTNNVLVNGHLDIWQRGSGTKFSSSSGVLPAGPDMFYINHNQGGAINITRGASAPTVAQCGQLLNSCMLVSVSAVGSVANAANFTAIKTLLEGYDWRALAQKQCSFSFWVNSNRTGTYCIAFTNSGSNQSYVVNYSISSVSTWEKKTFVIPESPVAGTWDYSSGTGIRIFLTLAAGANLQGGAGNWTATSILATSSQTNFCGSAGNVISFAGFKLNEGPYPAPLEWKDYNEELARARRYLPIFTGGATQFTWQGQATGAGSAIFNVPFDIVPRVTISSISVGGGAVTGLICTNSTGGLNQISAVAFAAAPPGYGAFTINTVGGAGLASGNATTFAYNGTRTVVFKGAELA